MQVQTKIDIDPKKISDLFVTAIEGGCDYWMYSMSPPDTELELDLNPDNLWYTNPEIFEQEDFNVVITDEEDERFNIDLESIKTGLALMSTKYPQHFANVVNDNHDAITADVFIQLCAFEDIWYG